MKKIFEGYWGIDVSKAWLDIDTGEEVFRINQTKTALKKFIKKQGKNNNAAMLAVLESTGGYEQLAVSCLAEENVTVHIAHPSKVKAFARAKGHLAKTDVMDAKLLRDYGRFIETEEIKPLPTERERKLALLGSRLEQLKEIHHQESCRLGMAEVEGEVKESIEAILEAVKGEITAVKEILLTLIDSDEVLKEKYELLCSMTGIGSTIAMKLITDLPELGKATKKEIAALVGVAPITHTSGQKIGKAMTKYGRFEVRRALYMGALVASRHHPKFRAFYEKLKAAGKAPKVALVAVMRKMIVILNAMVQSKKHFYA
jgi:transposase